MPTKKENAKIEVASKSAKTKKNEEQHSKDYTKYQFNGGIYGKGRLVLAVVQDYVEKHPTVTVPELQKTFTVENISNDIISTPKRDKV